MNFWGTRTGHRSQGRSLKFAADALNQILEGGTKLTNVFFCCEPVDWSFVENTLQLDILKDRILNEDDLKIIANLNNEKKEALLDEMRKFRRFMFYSNGSSITRFFPNRKMRVNFYIDDPKNYNDFSHFKMGNFIQPPIREPFNLANSSELWLFNITINSNAISAYDAAKWIYENFFLYTLETSGLFSNGYKKFLRDHQEDCIKIFSENSIPCEVQLRNSFKPHIKWLNFIKKHMLEEQKNGNHQDRWDIQL